MTASKLIFTYFFTLAVFLIVDLLWLGVVAKGIYAKYLSEFLSDQVNWTSAIIFYLLYIVGIMVFVIHPGFTKNSVTFVLLTGAFFGFITYATYDLTNLATLKNWPLSIVVIDIAWGTLLGTIVSFSGYQFLRWIS